MQAPPTTGQHNLAISRPNNITCWWTVASLSMRHCGTCPLEFWKFCAFGNCCQLNCKHFENYQRKTCITFSSISPKTRYISPGTQKKPLTSFPGDANC